ncbi:MAG: phage tail family protein [Paraclostridium sp.]
MQIRYINQYNKEIKFDTKPSSLRLYDLEGRSGLQNNISFSNTTYIDGSTVNSQVINKRDMSIVGKIISRNVLEVDQIKRDLTSTFTLKGEGILFFKDNENSKEYCIRCVVSKGVVFSQDDYGIVSFIIELISPNPFWKDGAEAKVEIANIKGAFHFPLRLPTIMGYKEPSLIVNCNNTGDVNIGMRLEFIAKNPLTNPSLFDVNTRQYIKINKAMVKGEKIIIDTNIGQKGIVSVIDNVETKILHLMDFDSSFLQLQKGDNLYRYNADTGIEFLTCNIYYSPSYLGV